MRNDYAALGGRSKIGVRSRAAANGQPRYNIRFNVPIEFEILIDLEFPLIKNSDFLDVLAHQYLERIADNYPQRNKAVRQRFLGTSISLYMRHNFD